MTMELRIGSDSTPFPVDGTVHVPLGWYSGWGGNRLTHELDSEGNPSVIVLDGSFWLFTASVKCVGDPGAHVELAIDNYTTSVQRQPAMAKLVLDSSGEGIANMAGVIEGSDGGTPPGPRKVSLQVTADGSDNVEVTTRLWQICEQVQNPSDWGQIRGKGQLTADSSTFTGTPVKINETTIHNALEGRTYLLLVNGEVEMTSASSGVSTQHEIRVSQGFQAVTSSDELVGRAVVPQDPGGLPTSVQVVGYWTADADYELVRIGLFSHRPVGSATCQWTADVGRPMTVTAIDLG